MNSEFSFKSRVFYCDTDAGGVVYHSRYLDFCEKARTEFLRSRGIVQSKILQETGIGFVVTSCQIDFKKSAKLDDLLSITVNITENNGLILKMEQKILNENNDLVLFMKVNLVCVNRNSKPVKIPQIIYEAIK